MAIIYSYPLNKDIKIFDEIVGTTKESINGQLKTVTRNFLLQDLAEFFIVDGGLQKKIILTTNSVNGPATLDQVTGILNIPRYDIGNVTSVSAIAPITSTIGTTPIISTSMSTNKLIGRYSEGDGIFQEITLGDGLSFSGNTLNAATSVTPAALTKVDDTNVTLTLGGTPATSLLQDVSLTLGWTGTLSDSRIASASNWNAKENSENKQNSLAIDGTGTKFPTVDAVNAGITNSNYWTKTGDDIQNNNIGNTQVKILTGKQFQLLNSANTVVGYIDETGIGKFGAGSTYTSFGPASANIHLNMVRTQMNANFTLGNPQVSQPFSIISTNYFGTSYVAGSAEVSASAVAEHSFNIGNSIGNGITSGIFRISRTRLQSTVPVKYATDLSLSYDDRTLVDKGYVTTAISTKENSLPTVPVDGYVLSSTTAGVRSWIPMTGGGSSPLTNKGDLYTFSTVNTRLPVGTDGQILTVNSSVPEGLSWQDNYADWTSVVKHLVKNNGLSGTITKGTAVYVTSSDGTNMLVGRASNTSESTSSKTMGLMQSDITTTGGTQNGFVITEGLLEGLNTAGTTAGDPVWLGVNGALIYGLINKPFAPDHLVFIGIVTKVSAGNGEIFVKVQNGFELKELHDVQAQNPTLKDTLYYDNTVSPAQWKTASISTILGYTPADDANVVHKTNQETIAGVKTFTSEMNTTGITSTTNANLAVPIKGIANYDGVGNQNNIGVLGEINGVSNGIGVKGVSLSGYGVVGQSSETSGIYGYTTSGAGVEGLSSSGIGLVGNGPIGIQANSDAVGISIPLQTNTIGLTIVGLTSININAFPIYISIDDAEVMSVNRQGHINANSFKKIGGLSTQYLMADGTTTTGTGIPSQSAYTILANNTNASAVPTEQVFKNVTEQVLSGIGMTATGGALPTGINTHFYRWSQIGNLVTVRINLQFQTAGTCSGIAIPFANMPDIPQIPQHPNIYVTALDMITFGSGSLASNKSIGTFAVGSGMSGIRIKTIGTPNTYEIVVGRASGSYNNGWIHVQYYI